MVTAAQAYWLNRKRRRARNEGVGVPSWVLSGAALDLDFAGEQGFNSLDRAKLTPDDILTYTAPSPKMVYGVDGVMRYANHNLFPRSQEFDVSPWSVFSATVTANSISAPDGTTTADTLFCTSASGRVYQNITVVAGASYAISIYAKSGTHNRLYIEGAAAMGAAIVTFDLDNGTVVSGSGGSIVAAGNGWYRCVVIGTAASSGTGDFRFGTADGTSKTIYVWGAQLTASTTVTTYIPTTSAARYSLPIDHDPITFDPLGVLIEEQRTNLLTYSADLSNAIWQKTNLTLASDDAVAPDGTTTADKITAQAGLTTHQVYKSSGFTLTAAAYTYSVFLKQGTHSKIVLTFATAAFAFGAGVPVDLATGTIGAIVNYGGHTGATAAIIALPNDWYRVSITINAGAAVYFGAVTIADATYATSWNAAGTESVYQWGAQEELGAFATSYIPTVASQVTRAADSISILTSAFAFNAAAGTVACSFDVSAAPQAAIPSVATLSDGTNNEVFYFTADNGTSTPQFSGFDGASGQFDLKDTGFTLTANTAAKTASAYALNDFAFSVNARSVQTDVSGTLPTVTTLYLGYRHGGSRHLNGHIKRLTYFPTRKSNIELQALTA